MGNTAVPGGSAYRLVGKSLFEPSLSKNVLPLTKAANGPNSAISLTQTFDRILFYVCNSRYFEVQKAKNGDQRSIVFAAALKQSIDQPGKDDNPSRGQLNRFVFFPLSFFVPEDLVSRDRFGRPVPRPPV